MFLGIQIIGIAFSMVFTKIDKLSSSALQKNLAKYKKEMLKSWEALPPVYTTSSVSKFGQERILNYIEQINANFTLQKQGAKS